MNTAVMGRFLRVVAFLASVLIGAAAVLVAASGTAEAADPVCQSNSFHPGGRTCLQLVPTSLGNYQVTATGTVSFALSKAWLELTAPNGVPDIGPQSAIRAGGTLSYTSSGFVAGPGKWCAVLKFKDNIIGSTWTATNSPLPCVTVPNLPTLPGSARQVCATPSQYPQFETCIDVVNGAVVAKGYGTVSSPQAYLTLTRPDGTVLTGPTTATTAGQTFTYSAAATAGRWCANYWNIFPAVHVPLNVTGSTPPCLTV